jgi:neutral ceramidase
LLGADRQDPPFVGIMSNGTSGDVTNQDRSRPSSRSYKPYESLREVADDVAKEVLRVYNNIQHHDWVSLQAAQEKLTLNVRKPDRQMIERAKWILSQPDTIIHAHRHERDYAGRVLGLMNWPDQIDIVLQTFRIGELGIATSPFETFAETGMEIKARSPFKPTFTISFAHGHYGYLPTPRQHELGGYETWLGANRVEINASEKIVSKIIELFERLE